MIISYVLLTAKTSQSRNKISSFFHQKMFHKQINLSLKEISRLDRFFPGNFSNQGFPQNQSCFPKPHKVSIKFSFQSVKVSPCTRLFNENILQNSPRLEICLFRMLPEWRQNVRAKQCALTMKATFFVISSVNAIETDISAHLTLKSF